MLPLTNLDFAPVLRVFLRLSESIILRLFVLLKEYIIQVNPPLPPHSFSLHNMTPHELNIFDLLDLFDIVSK